MSCHCFSEEWHDDDIIVEPDTNDHDDQTQGLVENTKLYPLVSHTGAHLDPVEGVLHPAEEAAPREEEHCPDYHDAHLLQHSTVQYSTVQHSTVQHLVQHRLGGGGQLLGHTHSCKQLQGCSRSPDDTSNPHIAQHLLPA